MVKFMFTQDFFFRIMTGYHGNSNVFIERLILANVALANTEFVGIEHEKT